MERTPLQPENPAVPDRLVPIAERPRLDPPPRIFAASLLDYNAGLLHGQWLGVARPTPDVRADLDAILRTSPTAGRRHKAAGEWLILAHEGFGGCTVREVEPLERLTDLARRIRTYGQAFAAWARLDEGNLEHHLRFETTYLGHYDSVQEYVTLDIDAGRYDRLAEAAVPEHLRPYVDIRVADLARDLLENGDLISLPADDNGVFLFSGLAHE